MSVISEHFASGTLRSVFLDPRPDLSGTAKSQQMEVLGWYIGVLGWRSYTEAWTAAGTCTFPSLIRYVRITKPVHDALDSIVLDLACRPVCKKLSWQHFSLESS